MLANVFGITVTLPTGAETGRQKTMRRHDVPADAAVVFCHCREIVVYHKLPLCVKNELDGNTDQYSDSSEMSQIFVDYLKCVTTLA